MPYGVGYDEVIKKKTEMIDKQKYWNNRVMDELIEKLGYMDYRDALACNKYILETKRHNDYHQQARGKILAVAMAKYNALKKHELEQQAAQAAQTPNDAISKDEAKLKIIMNEDPEMAELYRDAYQSIKNEKEYDYNEANRIYNRFAYQFDNNTLNTVKDSKYQI